MTKRVIVYCREDDPDVYSGLFEVEDEFLFRTAQGTERELRLEDGRIVRCKPTNNPYVVYCGGSFKRLRNHKIKKIEFLYQPEDIGATDREKKVRR